VLKTSTSRELARNHLFNENRIYSLFTSKNSGQHGLGQAEEAELEVIEYFLKSN